VKFTTKRIAAARQFTTERLTGPSVSERAAARKAVEARSKAVQTRKRRTGRGRWK
jgi:hypothetical protein